VIRRDNLGSLRLEGSVRRLHRKTGIWVASIESRGRRISVPTRRVILALGAGDVLRYPKGFEDAPHVYAGDFAAPTMHRDNGSNRRITIVGAGLAGVQLGIWLADSGISVTIIDAEKVSVAAYDSDPCFLGRKCGRMFVESPLSTRRARILRARNPGSVPENVADELSQHVRAGSIRLVQRRLSAETSICSPTDPGAALERAEERHPMAVGRVRVRTARCAEPLILATGFSSRRPGGRLVDSLVDEESLPVYEDGYPILHHSLEWAPSLFVTGKLAELELGPSAGNISGAHMAGKTILAAVGARNPIAARFSPWEPLRE